MLRPIRQIAFRKIGENRGATAVEFAVIVPLVLVILFAILEFGFIFLQEHFVANAAREGVRIGVRYNNYDSFTTLGNNTTDGCNEAPLNRAWVVDCQMRNYLETLYARDVIVTNVSRDPSPPDGTPATLEVSVEVPNFYPQILSNLINILPGGGNFAAPNTISFTATGDYEDLSEP